MEFTAGERIPGLVVDGKEVHGPVVNENQVRAAAGLTLVIGAIAFAYAYFDSQYVPLQIASTIFFVEFLIRVTIGIRYSPVGVVARAMTRGLRPDWVSAKPKRFAWEIGLGLAFSMMVVTNSGIRGTLPRTICAICLTMMWLESALGCCLGCKLHAALVRRGWADKDPEIEVCAHGICELPARDPRPVNGRIEVDDAEPRATGLSAGRPAAG